MFEKPSQTTIETKLEKPNSESLTPSGADKKLSGALREFSDFHLHNVDKFTPEEQKQWNRTIIEAKLAKKELGQNFQKQNEALDQAIIKQILPLIN